MSSRYLDFYELLRSINSILIYPYNNIARISILSKVVLIFVGSTIYVDNKWIVVIDFTKYMNKKYFWSVSDVI